MTTPTPEAIKSIVTQVETMHGILAYNGSQVVCACDRTWKPAEDYAAHITRAATPFIAAQAKAEALREAADDPKLRLSGHSGISITRLRARAATIEGKDQ